MKKILLILLLFVGKSFAQSVSDYQYVIVPEKFHFFDEKDKYRLNTNTKLLLEKHGFEAFLNSEVPAEIAGDRCSFLYADVEEKKTLFVTRLKVILADCNGKTIFETDYGTSREKDFNVAYNRALRDASKYFDGLNYKYNGAVSEKGKEENSIINSNSDLETNTENSEIFFFAQPVANGFQVVNSEPKVIMRLFNTSQKNVFIAVKDNIHGVVIQKGNVWFFEYYENVKLVSELINLKF